MTVVDKIRTFSVFIVGALIPATAVLTATSTWAALATPHIVVLMLLGGFKALRDLWSHAPDFGNVDKLPEDQIHLEPDVVEVEPEIEPITREEIISDFQDPK